MQLSTSKGCISSDSFPVFSKPKVVGYYSVGPGMTYHHDFSGLKYLRNAPCGRVNYDLNYNVATSIERPEAKVKHAFLLNHFEKHREAFDLFDDSDISLDDVPFVAGIGALKNISTLPYLTQQPYRFCAFLFRGVVYLWSLELPDYMGRPISERETRIRAWGPKFEQYMVTDVPHGEPDLETPLELGTGFRRILEIPLKKHRLIVKGELDCVLVKGSSLLQGYPREGAPPKEESSLKEGKLSEEQALKELGECQFVELKSTRTILHGGHEKTFRRKSLNWWCQAIFAGVETVVCGFRDDEGIVQEVESFRTSDLPEIGRGYWDPNICLNSCDNTLTFVKLCFDKEIHRVFQKNTSNVRNLPGIPLVFQRLPGANVTLAEPLPHEDIATVCTDFVAAFPKKQAV